ncbi:MULTISPECIES: DUF1819 family protein [Bacillus]|uniref:DUF1819 family protein n=1 Tax=Bacillus TaxID=1386 RepID=UPI001F625216|nr:MULTISPECIES: DUF1819 family protein [Bacillus]MDA2664046.1 DUF1819 family protein [Bacillus cereus group sp. Bc032]MDA2674764.1 DUF1819 family protein [Bacillus cereus group sp. Bc031]MDA2680166.1 DUF1819 family protein [Bacillus cereus group sp. Bc029]MDA2685702.1 DUF1819 family protein [Bacillus cereus group sp. Bc030]MDA2741160.1 DUF1819 family protein [Bacillus cereus group sp. Bc011]
MSIMMENLRYSTTIKARPLLYLEMKKAATLVVEGNMLEQVKKLILEENIYQVKTESRKKEFASIVSSRLQVLDEFLMKQLVFGDVETSKLIVLYTIIKTDRLFYEFMDEVIKDKYMLRDFLLADKDFNIFFLCKREQSDVVSGWKDYTFYKLQQVFIRILFEVGILKNQKGERAINVPFLSYDVKQHLKEIGDGAFVTLLVGETV